MPCEMCGSDVPALKTVTIDGARLRVCDRCSKFGTEVDPMTRPVSGGGGAGGPGGPGGAHIIRKRVERDIFEEIGDDLVEDYAALIRTARQRLGLEQEELGQRIGEKRSVIQKLETAAMVPSDALIRKLERFLDISLTVPRKEVHLKGDVSKEGVTIGD
ncbi:MAG: multiprotein bridging factor aMBF1, partial [Thermoplasmata archaeon]|nr:multiprotein bridging factor aMBF1 [Thermoplasmata archaeon]